LPGGAYRRRTGAQVTVYFVVRININPESDDEEEAAFSLCDDGIKGPTDAANDRVSCQLHGRALVSVVPDRLG
jgi:hypothetical protein